METMIKGRFKTQTPEEFLERARDIHKDEDGEPLYLYDKTVYVSNNDSIIITCREHGDFEMTPRRHKEGKGCSKCLKAKKSNKDEFVKKAIDFHHDVNGEPIFNYDEVVYVNLTTPVTITCKNGHRFEQTPQNHLKGGCKECAMKIRMTTDVFVERASLIHINEKGESKYSYEKTKYKATKEKVIITCLKHGDFMITPSDILEGHGCAECSKKESTKKITSNKDEFIRKAILKHHDENGNQLFQYDEVDYVNSSTPVIITCSNGHRFEQTPQNHLKGGCKICTGTVKLNTEEFIRRSKLIHHDKDGNSIFDYSLVDYKNSRTKVTLICLNGHQFEQKPDNHLSGSGCPNC